MQARGGCAEIVDNAEKSNKVRLAFSQMFVSLTNPLGYLGGRRMELGREVQRAILLKAVMEALQKANGVHQSTLIGDKPEELRRRFWAFNANRDALAEGLAPYAATVAQDTAAEIEALSADPLWKQIIDFAVHGNRRDVGSNQIPQPLAPLRQWTSFHERKPTLAEMGGCWWLFRLSSTKLNPDSPEVTVSLLNIRPEAYYESNGGAWMEYALFFHSDIEGDDGARVDGICYHDNLQLYFLGFLEDRSRPLPTTMVLRYRMGGSRQITHRVATKVLLFVTNSQSRQISAPVVAVYIPKSDEWFGDKYQHEKSERLKRLGSHAHNKVSDILPIKDYQDLVERGRELIFDAGEG